MSTSATDDPSGPGEDAVDVLLARVLLEPAEGRQAFIEAETGEQPALARELQRRLASLEALGLDRLLADPDELPEHIGDYRILGLLGRGGMGSVFLAEQRSWGARWRSRSCALRGCISATRARASTAR